MTDEQLAEYIGVSMVEFERIKTVYPQRIEKWRRIAIKFQEVEAYDRGEGPRPKGVIICGGK